jgi:RND family efflux transporter MFP subunit
MIGVYLVGALLSVAIAQVVSGEAGQDPLERFRAMSPATRLRLVEKTLGGAAWQKAARGDVTATIVERGNLDAEGPAVYCKVRAGTKGSAVASIIRWIIDDGTTVQKGERLIELDDSELQDKLKEQRVVLARAEAAVAQATESLRLARRANQIEVKSGGAQAADLRLVRKGNEIEVKLAAANLRAKSAAFAEVKERVRELEEAIKHCFITAPQDGLVIYYVPEGARANNPMGLVAQGEPVREGQLLLRVCDLKRMTVSVRIDKAVIERVRAGQRATVNVDAFPSRPLTGKVTHVASVADTQSVFRDDRVVYRVRLALTGDLPGLKPGMSAAVRIVTAERRNVVQVPAQAVLDSGKDRFCYVKTARGVEERLVATGASNNVVVEIAEGLQAGEQVVRDLRPLIGQVVPSRPGK